VFSSSLKGVAYDWFYTLSRHLSGALRR